MQYSSKAISFSLLDCHENLNIIKLILFSCTFLVCSETVGQYLKDPNGHFGGIISAEYKYSNNQSPRDLTSPQYLRLNTHQKIKIQGLQFGVLGYYSTESNTIYSNNYLRFYFDKPQFDHQLNSIQQNITNKYNGQIDALQNERRKLNNELTNIENEKTKLNKMWSSNITSASHLKNIKTDIKSTEHIDNILPDSIINRTMIIDTLNQSILISDSIVNQVEKYNDPKIQFQIEKLNQKRKHLINHVNKIDSLIDVVNDKIKKNQDTYRSNLSAINGYTQNFPFKSKSWYKLISRIEKFNIGSFSSEINPLSLWSAPIRGLNLSVGLKKVTVETVMGLMPSINVFQFNRNNKEYNRRVGSFKIGFPLYGLNGSIFSHYIWDYPSKINSTYTNTVIGAGLQGDILKHSKFTCTFVFSEFDRTTKYKIETEPINDQKQVSFLDKTAYKIAFSYNLFRKYLIGEFLSSRNGLYFKNLGNIFSRTQYAENDYKLKFNILSGQMSGDLFYKTYHGLNSNNEKDNIDKGNGYGVSLKSQFKNAYLPNLFILYSPFEQGNNHPDSIMRFYNKFNMFNAGLIWRYNTTSYINTIQLFYSQSSVQLGENLINKYKTIGFQNSIYTMKGVYSSINLNSSISEQRIDSLQSMGVQIGLGINKRKYNVGLQGRYQAQRNGGHRKALGCQVSFKSNPQVQFAIKLMYNEYYKVWGLLLKQTGLTGTIKVSARI